LPDSSASSESDSDLKEWTAARTVLDNFDQRLSDLRKYGFTVITGLLSVSAIFTTSIPSAWQLAAILATMSLIVCLDLVDRNYRVFQEAGAIDAQVLERRSDINLTQTISRIYNSAHIKFFFQTVYIIFTLAALLLGWILLGGSSSPHLPLLAAIVILIYYLAFIALYSRTERAKATVVLLMSGVVGLMYMSLRAQHLSTLLTELLQVKPLHYHATLLAVTIVAVVAILIIEKAVDVRPWIYFGIDKYSYSSESNVSVIVSNIGPENLQLFFKAEEANEATEKPSDRAFKPAITVYKEDDPKMQEPLEIPELKKAVAVEISGTDETWRSSWSDQRWQFSTKNEKLPAGLYRVVYNGKVYVKGFRYGLFPYRLGYPTSNKAEEYDRWKNGQRFVITPKVEKKSTRKRMENIIDEISSLMGA
jgi:hypothetical protein